MNDTIYKFDKAGNVLPYYGNTVVSFLNDESTEIYKAALEFQNALKKTKGAGKLAFLPPDSFHMTVLNLCRIIDKETEYWPKNIPREEKFSYVDQALRDIVEKVPGPKNILMEVDQCKTTEIILCPVNAKSKNALEKYREELADLTGIRHPWHDTFKFHLTVDYQVNVLNIKEQTEITALCNAYTKKLKDRLKPFYLPDPVFVIFNDMMSYETDLSKRGNLY